MNLQEEITKQLSGDATKKIASQLGVDEATASNATTAAIEAILGGLQKSNQTTEAGEKLDATLSEKHSGSILENVIGAIGNASTQSDGAKILGHIFGNNDATATEEVAQKSGISVGSAATLMSILAPIILGQLGKAKQEHGLDVGGIIDLLKGQSGGAIGSIATGLLDKNKDGSIVDDVIGMATDFFKKK